jgi:2,3-bisphosphoglycerate-dependent phosphoglycerate mutase
VRHKVGRQEEGASGVELILIRHGLPEAVSRSNGRADPGLSSEGRGQARELARSLESTDIDAVYSSPMRRARETATPLGAQRGLEVRVEPGLAEFDRDAPFYIPFEELLRNGDERLGALLRGEYSGLESDGTLRPFQRRVVTTIEGLIDEHRGSRIAVVCHAGVLLAYLSHILGVEEMLFFRPAYTSIHRVLASTAGRRQIVTINEACHLAAVADRTGSVIQRG